MQTIALTAASSFTGIWIANHMASRGFTVHALLASKNYQGLKKLRVENLSPQVKKHMGVRAEDGSMARWIREQKPHVWIHHHHFMENFRSVDYDMERAKTVGLDPLEEIVEALRSSNCKTLIQSGSYFEAGEGAQNRTYKPSSYSLSKEKVWLKLLELRGNIAIAKVVIPNPVGPFENTDRLIPGLMAHAIQKKEFHLKTPKSVVDNLPVNSLAKVYESAILQTEGNTGPLVLRPSGKMASNEEFVHEIVNELLVKRLSLTQLQVKADQLTPSTYFQNNPQERVQVNWDNFWDLYAEKIRETRYLDTLIDS